MDYEETSTLLLSSVVGHTIQTKVHCTVHSIGAAFKPGARFRKQESPADARVTRDSAVIPRQPSPAILDTIKLEIAPFDPPTPKTLA